MKIIRGYNLYCEHLEYPEFEFFILYMGSCIHQIDSAKFSTY